MVVRVLERGWSLTKAAEAAEVSARTGWKWVGRYRAEGERGLRDRCSAPHSIPHRTPPERVEVIEALRRLRMTGAEIAECLGMARSTVSAVLQRIGLGKLSRLEPPEPPNRDQRRHPGELLHVDVKQLGRIPERRAGHRIHGQQRLQLSPRRHDAAGRDRKLVGWEYVHGCVDDATRLASVEVLPDEQAPTAARFLRHAVAFSGAHSITVEREMSDNRACYRSVVHALAGRALGLHHLRAPGPTGRAPTTSQSAPSPPCWAAEPTTPATAPAEKRTAALDRWLWTYNHRRPHRAHSHKPPIARHNELNNLPRPYRRSVADSRP